MHLIVIIALLVLIPDDAHAYLDPGTGSILIQSVIAGIAGALLVVKTYWVKIRRFAQGMVARLKGQSRALSETSGPDGQHEG